MSSTLIAIVTLIYLGVCASEWHSGNTAMALVFFGYAVANVGLIWQTL